MAINNVRWKSDQAMTFTKFQSMQDDSLNGNADALKGDDIHKQYMGSDEADEGVVGAFFRIDKIKVGTAAASGDVLFSVFSENITTGDDTILHRATIVRTSAGVIAQNFIIDISFNKNFRDDGYTVTCIATLTGSTVFTRFIAADFYGT